MGVICVTRAAAGIAHPEWTGLPIVMSPGHADSENASLYDCKASPELAKAFERRATTVVCSEDQVLFRDGQPGGCVYLVLEGEVVLFLPLAPLDGIGFHAHAGAFVGLPAAFSNSSYSMTAVVRKNTTLAVMGRDKFCDLVATESVFAMDVLRILAAETRAARITIVEAEIGRKKQGRSGE